MDAFIAKYGKLGEGFNRQEIAQADEHPGRRTNSHGYQSAPAWLDDLTSTKKCVLLCNYCRVKFNPRKARYRRMYSMDYTGATDGYTVNGRCDACKQHTVNCGGGAAFIAEEEYSKICIDPVNARRAARAKARDAWSAWNFINNSRRT